MCPASCTTDTLMVQATDSILRSWGYETVISDLVYENWHDFAGTPEQRRDEVVKYLEDPQVKCIFSLRGGWGSIQQMRQIPLGTIRKHPKWLVGFSDITSMHAAWNAAGVMSIHGPMGGQLQEENGVGESSLYLKRMLEGELPVYNVETHLDSLPMNRPGHAEGRLVGGNVETWMPSVSTDLDILGGNEDVILFIEDVGENINHIERRIVYLEMHGLLEHVRGIICGYFTEYTPEAYESMEEMLDQHFAPLGIPVAYNFPVGHQLPNYPLLHGAHAVMDVTETAVTLSYPDQPLL